MSGPFSMILTHGHSAANAENIRAWFKAVPEMAPGNRRAYVRDYEKRGYLNAHDARALVQEFAPE